MASSIPLTATGRTAVHPLPENISHVSVRAPAANQPDRHGRELFLNHLWESLNSGAKILFFAVVTPIMLTTWGTEEFGLFAVANSCVALMGFLDLGLRTLTRVALTKPNTTEEAKVRLHALNTAAFAIAAFACIAVIAGLAQIGWWHHRLHLPQSADMVITVTAILTSALMLLQLLLERIAASGHLSRIKAALFAGNLLALVVVLTALKHGAMAAPVTLLYFAALTFPALFLLPFANLQPRRFFNALANLRLNDIITALQSGRWINLITASWIFQSYGLVLLMSWLLGPAAAGIFFLYLKLSEVLSVLGASASEPTIAAVASAKTLQDRHRRFATGYKSAIALCTAGAIAYAFFSNELFQIWLHRTLQSPYTGLLIGIFGLTNGITRMVTAASLGLSKPRPIALGLLFGAIVITASLVAFRDHVGPETILAIGSASVLFILPSAISVARDLGTSFAKVWLKPLVDFAPAAAIISAACWAASYSNHLWLMTGAIIFSALISGWHIFAKPPEGQTGDSRLGYDTRSLRSALVMRGVDLINPFRRAERFRWSGPCIVSSVAGLGDLIIHLPLIDGILREAQRRGLDAHVALRPAHVPIGKACGWNVFPFDPALEDFFKHPLALKPSKLLVQLGETRRMKPGLWIDLTGNAVNALSIKCGGARRIAARVTRGGRSLINHPLPHQLHENEYTNVTRVAETVGCEPNYGIFDRLRGQPDPESAASVVLCLTTICRWRNWPLANFLALVDRLPETKFIATGFAGEVLPEERVVFEEILTRPNVLPRVDSMSILELIRLIAHARAVVTNDTSTAHIANAFHKPGAVLFGPASADKLTVPYGLKGFGDQTCPFHPCVQWTCANQENWCMRKIRVESVGEHLANVLGTECGYAATASVS